MNYHHLLIQLELMNKGLKQMVCVCNVELSHCKIYYNRNRCNYILKPNETMEDIGNCHYPHSGPMDFMELVNLVTSW